MQDSQEAGHKPGGVWDLDADEEMSSIRRARLASRNQRLCLSQLAELTRHTASRTFPITHIFPCIWLILPQYSRSSTFFWKLDKLTRYIPDQEY